MPALHHRAETWQVVCAHCSGLHHLSGWHIPSWPFKWKVPDTAASAKYSFYSLSKKGLETPMILLHIVIPHFITPVQESRRKMENSVENFSQTTSKDKFSVWDHEWDAWNYFQSFQLHYRSVWNDQTLAERFAYRFPVSGDLGVIPFELVLAWSSNHFWPCLRDWGSFKVLKTMSQSCSIFSRGAILIQTLKTSLKRECFT